MARAAAPLDSATSGRTTTTMPAAAGAPAPKVPIAELQSSLNQRTILSLLGA